MTLLRLYKKTNSCKSLEMDEVDNIQTKANFVIKGSNGRESNK
jgi:hypothetical protein